MIVFDLICRDGSHQFEGWFGSSDDYEKQLAAGLIDCPSCGSSAIEKAVMAPNVGVKGNQRTSLPPASSSNRENIEPAQSGVPMTDQSLATTVSIPAEYQELIGKLAKAQTKMLEQSKWVGSDFPEQARAIHYGEKDATPIHGTASADDVTELQDEGIDIMPLPLPVTPPKAQN
ncbi:DUF1178 family protein [Parasphingorhabdus sp. JC815]|uniref:DUF1178 family protein n=1 Tax=Parasphingorhabdus sp. JC815 TaxID=3232140 RepID=UPI003457FD18